jgi:lysozyme
MFDPIDLIKRNEGFRQHVYKCSAGALTVGYGTNLESRGVTRAEAEILLRNEVVDIRGELVNLDFWGRLDIVRQGVLIDMAYNLGMNGLFKFRKMLAAISNEDWQAAHDECLDSNYAEDVPARAHRNAQMLLTGNVA